MNFDWLHEPTQVMVLSVLPGAGLIGFFALWVSAELEARALKKAFAAFRLSTETAIRDMGVRIEELRPAPACDPEPPALIPFQSVNLTTRAKALRMHRRGETIPGIAAALGVQREEIDLLLKLDRLLEARAG
jgi:hypothetical protein